MNTKIGLIKRIVIYSIFIATIFMKNEAYGKDSEGETIENTLRQLDNEIEKENADKISMKISNLGITPFSVSVIGYQIDFSGYRGTGRNIIDSSIKDMTTNINLNKIKGEAILFQTNEFNFDRNASILVKKNGIRDKGLERILKGKSELGKKYIEIDSSSSIIKITYPKEMKTYDKYEIVIYMRATLNDNQKINRYISNYVKNGKSKDITVQNNAKIEYEIATTIKDKIHRYTKYVSRKSEINIPYKYPPRIH